MYHSCFSIVNICILYTQIFDLSIRKINTFNKEFKMAKSCRVVITRTNTDVALPHEVFFAVAQASAKAHVDMGLGVTSYIQGYTGTEIFVDHVVENNATYDANKELILSVVPWWQNAGNHDEVEEYQTANGITVTVIDQVEPNISGAFDCTKIYELPGA